MGISDYEYGSTPKQTKAPIHTIRVQEVKINQNGLARFDGSCDDCDWTASTLTREDMVTKIATTHTARSGTIWYGYGTEGKSPRTRTKIKPKQRPVGEKGGTVLYAPPSKVPYNFSHWW